MSQPTTGILLNSTAPAAPAGNQNVKPQSDGATPLQSISFYPQPATPTLLGVVQPDGTTITVDGTGKISAAVLANPMTTAGDIIVGGAAGAPTRLAAGAAATVLTSNGPGVAPSYQAGGGGSGGNKSSLGTTASFIASPPAAPAAGDSFRCLDSDYAFFYSGTVWLAFFRGIPVTLPPQSGWTWDNQGAGTLDATYGAQFMYAPKTGNVELRTQYRSAPSTPYTITASIVHDLSGVQDASSTGSQSAGFGIGFRDGSGKCVSLLYILNGGLSYQVQTDKWNTAASYNANYLNIAQQAVLELISRQPAYLQISDDGTNLIFRVSMDRIHWAQFYSVSRTDFMASGPSEIWWGAYANTEGAYASLVDWQQS